MLSKFDSQEINDNVDAFITLLEGQNFPISALEKAILSRKTYHDIKECLRECFKISNPWNADFIKHMSIDEGGMLRTMFFFRGDRIKQWRKELLEFCIENVEFRKDNINELAKSFAEAITSYNNFNGHTVKVHYVNAIPEYNGIIIKKKPEEPNGYIFQ